MLFTAVQACVVCRLTDAFILPMLKAAAFDTAATPSTFRSYVTVTTTIQTLNDFDFCVLFNFVGLVIEKKSVVN